MTIKKRLLISNILMIVIPLLIAVAVSIVSIYLTYYWLEQKMNMEKIIYTSFDKVADLAIDALEMGDISDNRFLFLSEYNVNMVISDQSGQIYRLGNEDLKFQEELLNSIEAMGYEGFSVVGDEEIYAQIIQTANNRYMVCILYNVNNTGYNDVYYGALTSQTFIVGLATLAGIIIAGIVANHFLGRFVFHKIQQSLDLLADGVHQIKDGNLEYRLLYPQSDEFTPVCDDFNNMAQRLQQSVELTQRHEQNRKELIAGISHDLRSPLTSIRAYIEGLMDGVADTPEAQAHYMQMIKTKTEDIDHMVSKLFLFSKMDMGEYPYYPELLDLSHEMISYLQATKEEYLAKGLMLSLEHMDSDMTIYADPLHLRSILANIFENSLKYKDKPDAKMLIYVNHIMDKACITLDDNGPGVSEDALDKLFHVFYRSDQSRNNPNKGSGLGLAITAKAVNYMGGTIHAENIQSGGLRIIIEIPLTRKEQINEKSSDH